jgi:hypothetical protein
MLIQECPTQWTSPLRPLAAQSPIAMRDLARRRLPDVSRQVSSPGGRKRCFLRSAAARITPAHVMVKALIHLATPCFP